MNRRYVLISVLLLLWMGLLLARSWAFAQDVTPTLTPSPQGLQTCTDSASCRKLTIEARRQATSDMLGQTATMLALTPTFEYSAIFQTATAVAANPIPFIPISLQTATPYAEPFIAVNLATQSYYSRMMATQIYTSYVLPDEIDVKQFNELEVIRYSSPVIEIWWNDRNVSRVCNNSNEKIKEDLAQRVG
jgi:hypothetical protein